MARSFNQVILMGNLTRDPELRTTPNGTSVCSFSLALNRSYRSADGEWQEATDFIDIVAWGPLGERVAQYLSKGRGALVNGRLQSRSWEQDVTFLGGPGAGPATGNGGVATADEPAKPAKEPAKKGATKKGKKDEEEVVI